MVGSARRDLISAIGLALIAGYVVWRSWTSDSAAFADAGGITPGTLPGLYGLLLMALAGLLALNAFRTRRGPDAPSGFALTRTAWLRIAASLVFLTGYALLLPVVPFFVLTAAFLALMFVVYGHRRPAPVLAVALIGAGALDLLFLRVLQLPL